MERMQESGINITMSAYYEPDKLARMYIETYFVWDADEGKPIEQLGEIRCRGEFKLKYWRGDFYIWHKGRYTLVSDGDMKADIVKHLQWLNQYSYYKPDPQIKITKGFVENIMLNIAALDGVFIQDWREMNTWQPNPASSEDFAVTSGKITTSFLNGLVLFDINNGKPEFIAHTPAYFSMIRLPYNYDAAARCPRWEAFLDDVMTGDSQRIELLQEWAGYVLSDTLKLQKFMLLAGEGGNGKTVFTTIIEKMVGEDNVSHIPLSSFDKPFTLSATLGKSLNSTSESSHGLSELCETMLKSYTSGDRMTFERKYREPVNAYPTAKEMISTNQLPNFTDKSNGIWRRLLFVPFDKCVPVEEQNPDLVEELSAELPGIFNWAIEGLRKLMADGPSTTLRTGRFIEPKRCVEAIAEYRRETNPARVFLEENYVEDFGFEGIPCGEMYQNYLSWCNQNGFRNPLNSSNFGKEVKRSFSKMERKNIRTGRKQNWVYRGICIKG